MLDLNMLSLGWRCKCPCCGRGDLYQSAFSLILNEHCPDCALDLSKNDSADGPAVFLIFILGFALVPLALFVDFIFHPALWVHALVWGVLALGLTVGALRPLKAYIIALQYKHRPGDWRADSER